MSLFRRASVVALTLFLIALFSAFAWSADAPPHSFRVSISGHGPAVILIPGLASSGETWTTTVARYRDRFECHVLTLAGFAGVPAIGEPLLAAVRAELPEYIRSRHLDHPIIIGHSLGGTIAMAVAADRPDLVGPLVIVDMMPFLAGTAMQAASLADAQPRIAAMRAGMNGMTDAQWVEYAQSGRSVKYMVTRAADLDTLTRWSVASDRHAITDALADAYGLDLREDLARIRTPVLALLTWKGVRDEVLDAAKFEITRPMFEYVFAAQFEKLPRLHLTMTDTARHFIMFDDPQWFFAQLDAFLADPDAAVRTRGTSGR
jgi:pimeloyl-ACP methyl ester carboxylesterase